MSDLSTGVTGQYCSRCGREKTYYFDPAYGGSVDIFCQHCSGVIGWIRRRLGRTDVVSPLPENPAVSKATVEYVEGDIDHTEFESRVEEALE